MDAGVGGGGGRPPAPPAPTPAKPMEPTGPLLWPADELAVAKDQSMGCDDSRTPMSASSTSEMSDGSGGRPSGLGSSACSRSISGGGDAVGRPDGVMGWPWLSGPSPPSRPGTAADDDEDAGSWGRRRPPPGPGTARRASRGDAEPGGLAASAMGDAPGGGPCPEGPPTTGLLIMGPAPRGGDGGSGPRTIAGWWCWWCCCGLRNMAACGWWWLAGHGIPPIPEGWWCSMWACG